MCTNIGAEVFFGKGTRNNLIEIATRSWNDKTRMLLKHIVFIVYSLHSDCQESRRYDMRRMASNTYN